MPVVLVRGELLLDVDGDVGVVDHHHHDDVEGVGEEVVNHLQVGGLGHHRVDAALDVGNDDHGCDGDHDAVLEVVHPVVEGHVGHDQEQHRLQVRHIGNCMFVY